MRNSNVTGTDIVRGVRDIRIGTTTLTTRTATA